MTVFTLNIRDQIDALTAWWEDAGVPVDHREIERLIRETESQSAEIVQHPAARVPLAVDQVARARSLAKAAADLNALTAAIADFDGCDLKSGASRTVIYDGAADASVMVIGEGPSRDEDLEGKPFVGQAGQLLDKMLASIGLSRETNTFLTHVNFWRPPGGRNPTDEELAICRPFVDRQIELVQPKLIIAAGAVPTKSLLGEQDGITRLRGKTFQLKLDGISAIPVFPTFHPAYLLRRPAEKAKAWTDLLHILSHLRAKGIATASRP